MKKELKTIKLPLGDMGFLVAQESYDSQSYKEICTFLEDKNGVIVQDLAIIRQKYSHNENLVPIYENKMEVLVFGDCDDEDYTNKFVINVVNELIQKGD